MRVAALYDIHANLPALEAVMADVRAAGVDRIIVGGDVLPGPMPRETLDFLLSLDLPVDYLHGNGDRVVLEQLRGIESSEVPVAYRDDIRWNAEQLTRAHQQALETWPATLRIRVEGAGDVLFCHATPASDLDIFTKETPDDWLRVIFGAVSEPLVVCGHTHMQFDRLVGTTRLVNAGSVGMPFMPPGAYWLLLGPDVELRRTSYDLERAAARVRATAYPHAEEFAATNILSPPTERAMLEAFRR